MLSDAARALVVAAEEVPDPVIEQSGEPAAANAPTGNVSVQETSVPEMVPANVPLALSVALAPVSIVTPNTPVAFAPLRVATQVTEVWSLEPGATNVPDQEPVKSSPEGAEGELGEVEFEPHAEAKTAATNTASTGK